MTARSQCELLNLFEQRRDSFRRLLELSRVQMQLLAAHDYTQLLALQGEKQRLLSSLDAGSRDHFDLKGRWLAERDDLPARDRAECQAALDELELLVAEILQEERASAATLQEQLDETRRQLAALSQGCGVRTRYQAAAGSPAMRSLDVDT